MPPLNAQHHTSSVLSRASAGLPIWDQIDPGLAAVNTARPESPAPVFIGRIAHPRPAPGQVEVSSVFTKAWKREIYDAWVDLDLLPAFMRGFDHESEPERFELPWYLKLRDREVRWEAQTTGCVPGECISWKSGDRAACRNCGCVTFAPVGRAVTRVRVSLQFETSGDPAITDQTLKDIEFQLRDTFASLHIFLSPHALPPALASL